MDNTVIGECIEETHRLILDNLPFKNKRSSSGWVTFNCPMCEDSRARGGVIQSGPKISYHCFNCSFTTGWTPAPRLGHKYRELVDALGGDQTKTQEVQMNLLRLTDEISEAEFTDYTPKFYGKFNTVQMPEDAVSLADLDEDHPLVQYAKERQIYGLIPLYHFPDFAWRKRLIIPFMFNDELVGWSGRHLNPPNKRTPKYLDERQSGYVFNIDKYIDTKRKYVIIVEGPIDAILIDGVCSMGNGLTDDQIESINKLGLEVIVCPDRDKAGRELALQALELGWNVSIPAWSADCNDAAKACEKYGRMATIGSIIRSASKDKFKIEMELKLKL